MISLYYVLQRFDNEVSILETTKTETDVVINAQFWSCFSEYPVAICEAPAEFISEGFGESSPLCIIYVDGQPRKCMRLRELNCYSRDWL